MASSSSSSTTTTYRCGNCGADLNLSTGHLFPSGAYFEAGNKGTFSFSWVDDSKFKFTKEDKIRPFFETINYWGIQRKRTKMQCDACGFLVGYVYDDGPPMMEGTGQFGMGPSQVIPRCPRFRFKIKALRIMYHEVAKEEKQAAAAATEPFIPSIWRRLHEPTRESKKKHASVENEQRIPEERRRKKEAGLIGSTMNAIGGAVSLVGSGVGRVGTGVGASVGRVGSGIGAGVGLIGSSLGAVGSSLGKGGQVMGKSVSNQFSTKKPGTSADGNGS